MDPDSALYEYDDDQPANRPADFDYDDEEIVNNDISVGGEVYYEDQLAKQQQFYEEQLKLQQAAASLIPDVVRKFILYFCQCVNDSTVDNNVYEIHTCYETSFNRLTEKFYKNSAWPDPVSIVAPLVGPNNHIFLALYTEMYYRHIYAKLSPTLEDRLNSYNNYCNLFNYILNSDGPVDLELPITWTWDIIDEFIYQSNNFYIYRERALKKGNAEEIKVLRENPNAWSCYSVLNVLYSLIQKSKMIEQLKISNSGGDPGSVAGEYGSRPLYRTLGYFCIIGLLRVHCLLGDFTLALKTLDGIELNKKAMFARVATCHFTTYYYVGFCYFMCGRYSDAIKAFSHILLYISRTKSYNRSSQYDSLAKKSGQMYALLAICISFCPTRLDDIIHTTLREKYGDQLAILSRGGPESLKISEELFLYAAPKFISPCPPDFEDTSLNVDPLHFHLQVFLSHVESNSLAPSLRSFLKLYTSIDLVKLSGFLENDQDKLREALITFKESTRQLKWKDGSLLTGEMTNVSDLDISLTGDTVHISEAKTGRRFADWLLRNTGKYYAIEDSILRGLNSERTAAAAKAD